MENMAKLYVHGPDLVFLAGLSGMTCRISGPTLIYVYKGWVGLIFFVGYRIPNAGPDIRYDTGKNIVNRVWTRSFITDLYYHSICMRGKKKLFRYNAKFVAYNTFYIKRWTPFDFLA